MKEKKPGNTRNINFDEAELKQSWTEFFCCGLRWMEFFLSVQHELLSFYFNGLVKIHSHIHTQRSISQTNSLQGLSDIFLLPPVHHSTLRPNRLHSSHQIHRIQAIKLLSSLLPNYTRYTNSTPVQPKI